MKEDVLNLFYRSGLPPVEKVRKMINQPLANKGEFSEIYLERSVSRSFRLSERKISDIVTTSSSGAGIRVVKGNNTGFSFTENLAEPHLKQCVADAAAIKGSGTVPAIKTGSKGNDFYNIQASLGQPAGPKVELLKRAEQKAFSLSPYVEKVDVNLTEIEKTVYVINSLGIEAYDIRPMISFSVSVVLNKDNRREGAFQGGGGRFDLSYFDKRSPEQIAQDAVNQALILLEAKHAPAGEMEVILGAGESGILLHESIGHPLEADFNYRGSSAFTGKIGQVVASPQCTIIDDATLANERGSINIDDEGNEAGRSVLIENGILKTYMFDGITANHFETQSFNGRRQSFRYMPMPRMTNTYMLPGEYDRQEIIASVKRGVYAKTFSGGQVDISSGDFVFSVTEGYLVENGKISHPIKGATLIGNGPEILKRVTMVGDDMVISDGKWTCGKEGQNVPVGVGMPTVKLSHITVGGTANA